MKVGELVEDAARRFRRAGLRYGHGTDNARDEAAFLVLRGLGLPFNARDRAASPAEARKVESLVRKRIAARIPAAYLLGEAWLAQRAFYVDRRVIIPRSHIGELLEDGLKPWRHGPVRRVLDLCTGSGCLAILAAEAFPRAKIDAVDVSRSALAVAEINVRQYRMKGRIRLLHSDLFAALAGERYDVIISNPPYVAAPSMRKLPPEYRHEPSMALAGGRDGLCLVKRIVREVPAHLRAGGLLVCEIGSGRKAVERVFGRARWVWPQTRAGQDAVFMLRAEGRGKPDVSL